ncbi:MAG: hypothetical protein AAF401_16875, partial [Pseudomonadota bacterium]
EDFFASEATILILAAGTIAAALFGPTFLSTAETTNSMIADMQAQWTAWPTLFLGGVAAALFIAKAPDGLADWGWANWQIAGAAAYAAHVYAGFWLVFGGSFEAMFAKQGDMVAWSNLILLILWVASAAAAWMKWRGAWLHIAATALFMISGMLSAYFMGDSVVYLAGAIALGWVGAAIARFG